MTPTKIRILFLGIMSLCFLCVATVWNSNAYAQDDIADPGETPEVVEAPPSGGGPFRDAGVPIEETSENSSNAEELPVDEATTAEDINADPVGAVGRLVTSMRAGDWREFAAIALSLLMLLGAKARDKIAFFRGDRGGVIAIFTLSTAGALVTSLLAGTPIDFTMFYAALETGVLAMGGFIGFKKIFWPADRDGE